MLRSRPAFYFATLTMILWQVKSEKTYFFNYNRTSNEYKIVNRVNVNNSMRNYRSGMYLSELRNNVTRAENTTSKTDTHPILDSEWNYNWTNITRQKLPSYIYKLYEKVSKNGLGTVRVLFNARPQNSSVLRFNLSDIGSGEDYASAELHFHYKVDAKLEQKSLILRLYQIEGFNESNFINPDEHKLLNVIYIYQAESGWQLFKLTHNIDTWLKTKRDLFLFITVSRPNQEQFILYKDANKDVLRSFVVLSPPPPDNESAQVIARDSQTTSCRKYDLYLDFAKLNWLKFIISPTGYNAYNCFGSCHKTDKLPNHARVTNFYVEIARKPFCCIPTRYAPLTVMFYDKNGNVAIKTYGQMIVSGCGCR